MATRVVCDTMAHLAISGQLPRQSPPAWIQEDCAMDVGQAWR